MKYLFAISLLIAGVFFANPVIHQEENTLQQVPCKKKKKKGGCGCGHLVLATKNQIEVV